MFTHYRTTGFILKKTDLREADRLLVIYTKEFGKLELLAKAVRKIKSKLRAGLEIFSLSEVEFIQGKNYKTLTDAVGVNSFRKVKQDLNKLVVAFKIGESLDRLIPGEAQDLAVWDLLEEVFNKLNVNKLIVTGDLVYYYFLWNLLAVLGYPLELHYCMLCQKRLIPDVIYFNLKEKGLCCSQCQREVKIKKVLDLTPNVVKVLRIFLERDWATLEKLKVNATDFKLLKRVSSYYLRDLT